MTSDTVVSLWVFLLPLVLGPPLRPIHAGFKALLDNIFAMFLSGSLATRFLLLRGDAYCQVDCFAFSSIEHVAECHVAWLCSGNRSSSSGVLNVKTNKIKRIRALGGMRAVSSFFEK